jgi:hydrogenase maturation protease
VSAPDGALAVIGVGNVLLGDDGAGVRVLEVLRRRVDAGEAGLPPGTSLVDGGTLGLDLVRHLDGVRGLVVVDAADRGARVGSVTVRRGREALAAATANGAASHGLGEMLVVARLLGTLPPSVAIVELAVGEIAPRIGLSPAVDAALAEAAEATCREIAAMEASANEIGPRPRSVPAGASG